MKKQYHKPQIITEDMSTHFFLAGCTDKCKTTTSNITSGSCCCSAIFNENYNPAHCTITGKNVACNPTCA